MFSTSILEISRSALDSNIKFIKKQLRKNVRLSSVVKGNAYGHTIEAFVPLAEVCGLDHFSVYSADEALQVSNISTKNPDIMIMGMIDDDELGWAIEYDVEFYVFEPGRLQEAIKAAKRIGKKAKIHIELETGMNRTGFDDNELQSLINLVNNNKSHLDVMGVCTHYAGAESIANYVRVQDQYKKYKELLLWLEQRNIKPKYRHTSSSAATMRYPEFQMDLVRVGILQYGFWPSMETLLDYCSDKENKDDPLKRIITWKTQIMDTKEVSTGEFIGYGTSFLAHDNMKIATIPVGYSHGFSRSLSNTGRVLIRGQRVGVIGIVNMNMMIVNISNIPEVEKGDEVVLIGEQGDFDISVSAFGELSEQLNYELLTRLPINIPRVIVD